MNHLQTINHLLTVALNVTHYYEGVYPLPLLRTKTSFFLEWNAKQFWRLFHTCVVFWRPFFHRRIQRGSWGHGPQRLWKHHFAPKLKVFNKKFLNIFWRIFNVKWLKSKEKLEFWGRLGLLPDQLPPPKPTDWIRPCIIYSIDVYLCDHGAT